jgi:hypothetical protein
MRKKTQPGADGFMPAILATWDAEIRKITIKGQPRQVICETSISKITRSK